MAGAAYNPDFGDGTDVKSAGSDKANINSRSASLAIKGRFLGTPDAGDHFGFVAQTIDSIRIGKTSIPLNDSDSMSLRYNLANTLDVRIFEVAL